MKDVTYAWVLSQEPGSYINSFMISYLTPKIATTIGNPFKAHRFLDEKSAQEVADYLRCKVIKLKITTEVDE